MRRTRSAPASTWNRRRSRRNASSRTSSAAASRRSSGIPVRNSRESLRSRGQHGDDSSAPRWPPWPGASATLASDSTARSRNAAKAGSGSVAWPRLSRTAAAPMMVGSSLRSCRPGGGGGTTSAKVPATCAAARRSHVATRARPGQHAVLISSASTRAPAKPEHVEEQVVAQAADQVGAVDVVAGARRRDLLLRHGRVGRIHQRRQDMGRGNQNLVFLFCPRFCYRSPTIATPFCRVGVMFVFQDESSLQ
uniref:Uncharacterized protein n=1 Tax=Setaria italica TaxID=4555 RepID=K4AE72_SETIT